MRTNILVYIVGLLIAGNAVAQTRVVPAEPQNQPIALQGGTAHLGNGEVIENAVIGFEDGKLTIVADAARSRVDVSGYEVIDISGKHVYPGFILLNSRLGLEEVSSVEMTRDYAERGSVNPNVRTIIAYNTDSEIIPTYRFNGILMAQVAPASGLVSGSSSIVQLDAWNWEDAAYQTDDALFISWPSRRLPPRWWRGETNWRDNEDYSDQVKELRELFEEAGSYAKLEEPKATNLKLEAVEGTLNGSKALHIRVNDAKMIVECVNFAKDRGVERIVVVGGREAMKVAEFLKDNAIPVVLSPTHSQPSRPEGFYNEPYTLPSQLMEAGVSVALSHSGMLARGRNLPFYAGTAAAFGLSKEEALMTITSIPAEILGIDEQAGTLVQGKDATLFVSEGDALDMRSNKLSHAFIQGRQIQLEARQQWLYKKYAEKYDQDIE